MQSVECSLYLSLEQNFGPLPSITYPFVISVPTSVKNQTPCTNCQARWWWTNDLSLDCSHRTWTCCNPWVYHNICVQNVSSWKFELICLIAEALTDQGHQQVKDSKYRRRLTIERLSKTESGYCESWAPRDVCRPEWANTKSGSKFFLNNVTNW